MKTKKRFLSILLSLVMVLGLMPGMSMTALATETCETISFASRECGTIVTNHFSVVPYEALSSGDYGWILDGDYPDDSFLSISGRTGETITKLVVHRGGYDNTPVVEVNGSQKMPTVSGEVFTFDNINTSSVKLHANGYYTDDNWYISVKKIDVYYTGGHTHNFTYSANGATITATCGGSGTCDITEGLTLTISAPTGNLVYDGTTTYPAVLSTGYNTTAFPGTYSISYTKDGSAYSGVPKDAGTYTASVTAGTGDAAKTASVSYTVTKAAATVTKAPAAKTLTYTGSDQELVTAGTATGGEMQYALGTATEATEPYTTSIPQKINAGTYYVWYKVVGDENHFDTEPIPIEAKISEAPKTEGTPAQTEAPQTQTEASAPAVQAERITIPKKPAKVKTKARKNKVVVSWKRIKKNKKTKALRAMIKGIEVQYSTNPAFPKEATVTRIIKKNKKKLVLRGLTRKTLYYVRVRYLDGAGGYSRWSRVKRARTK